MWTGESSIREERLTVAKTVLVGTIAITTVLPLFFVKPDDAPLRTNVFKYLAKTGAFVGSMLLIWQVLLGFRGFVSTMLPDLSWVANLHKLLGKFGVPIIVLHPIFIGLYYVETRNTNIYALDLTERFSLLVAVGMVNLAIIAFIVITSAFLRDRLGFYGWLYTHLSSYLVPPFLFVHSFLLGPTVQGTGLIYYWWFFTAVMIALYAYRLAHKLGVSAVWYRVTRASRVADQTTEVLMMPEKRGLQPEVGQFIYLRGSIAENSHPYTVSAFDDDSGTLGVTIKQDGPQSTRLQESQEDDRLLLDGPFGIFTRPSLATELPLVMIAGGVGITAFRRLWQRLEREAKREAHLFYGNEYVSEIAYRDELDALEHVHVVHVLNQEPGFDGETGFVTGDVLRRNLQLDLDAYQFMLCGPPAMVLAIEEELTEAGVPDAQVRHELFSN